MDPRIEFYKAAFLQQGNGFNIMVFVRTSRYQYGQELGDVLHGILKFIPKVARFLKPVVMKSAQTLLKLAAKRSKRVPR